MDTQTYQVRRQALREAVAGGAILLLGNDEASRNYPENNYPFRQDSSFLYYLGAPEAGLAALLLPDGEEILFGAAEHPDDVVWMGPRPTINDFAEAAGFAGTADLTDLAARIAALGNQGATVHYLPPYRANRRRLLADLLGRPAGQIDAGVSRPLTRAVVAQREIKSPAEVAEIEEALAVTAAMYQVACRQTEPGVTEAHMAGALQAVALMMDRQQSFPPIVSIHGEVLHNTSYANTLAEGDLLVIDSGAESPRSYASDITRTIPVANDFTPQQREIYEVVLRAHQTALRLASPAVSNRELHLAAAREVVTGLQEIGLMRGDADEAVQAGAHALFFPHGLGHMLGLDVHDMEDLGDLVGYAEGDSRSRQFGLCYLRLAKQLRPGFVLTVEPGIYFIPALIERWRAARQHEAFIDYGRLDGYEGFGGIRIEDDVLITEDGCRILGPPIFRTADEVIEARAGS